MINNKLQLFLEKELLTKWDKKIIFTPDMKLYENFGLVGDDVDDFLIHFIKEFNIIISDDFNFDERFYPEAHSLYEVIKNIFNKEKIKISKLRDLSIAELQEAIETGILK